MLTITDYLKNNFYETHTSNELKYTALYRDNYEKQLQFAGFDKEEINVNYENDYLTVEGKSSMLNSHYCKKFYLPSQYYDVDNIDVNFEKCILTIKCKLIENKKSKTMKIIIK